MPLYFKKTLVALIGLGLVLSIPIIEIQEYTLKAAPPGRPDLTRTGSVSLRGIPSLFTGY